MTISNRFRTLVLAAAFMLAGLLPTAGPVLAAPQSGDLVKLPDDGNQATDVDSAVYYLGSDGRRYVFPNSQTYFTWYADFSSVKTVTAAEMAGLPIGGNVTYRPGTRLVKITSDPNVYAVEPGGKLRWVQSEAIAKALYGDAWNKRIDDVPDAYFFSYKISDPLSAAVYPDGSVVKRLADGQRFLIQNRQKRKITTAEILTALRIKTQDILTAAGDLSDYPDGADLVQAESLADTSQKAVSQMPAVPTFSVTVPASTLVNVGGDAILLELHLAAQPALTLRQLTVRIDAVTGKPASGITDDDFGGLVYGNNAQPNLRLLRLTDAAGNEPFGRKDVVVDVSQDQSQTFVWSGSWGLSANSDSVLYLKAQMNRLLPVGEKYKVTVVVAGTQLSGSAGSTVAFLPAADLAGPELATINEALLVRSSPVPGTPTYVRGAKNAAIAGLTLKATSQAPNVIKTMVLQGYVDSEGTAGFLPAVDADGGAPKYVRDILPNVSLYDDKDQLLGGPVPVGLDGRAIFTALDLHIPAGGTQNVIVKGDVPAGLDTGLQPDGVTFDVEDAGNDWVVVDDRGGHVNASGVHPNYGNKALNWAKILRNGTATFSWQGTSNVTIVGRETKLGVLAVDVKHDQYALRNVTFRRASQTSYGDARLEYPDADGKTVSVTVPWVGDLATFTNLAAVLPKDKNASLTLYTRIPARDSGAVYADVLGASLNTSGPLGFASAAEGTVYSEKDLGQGSFSMGANTVGRVTVRFSGLGVIKGSSTLSAVYRDNSVPAFNFTVKAEPEGPVRVQKIIFKLVPNDAGLAGSKNDALELWAGLPTDSIATLRRIYQANTEIIGTGGNGRMRFYEWRGSGSQIDQTQPFASAVGDYATLELTFDSGYEYLVPAGGAAEFRLDLNTAAFASDKDHSLSITILGDSNFLWTDIPMGSFTSLKGTDASGVPYASSLTVNK